MRRLVLVVAMVLTVVGCALTLGMSSAELDAVNPLMHWAFGLCAVAAFLACGVAFVDECERR